MQKTGTKIWDVIIIGAGAAGSSAAMVLARVRRKVLIIDDQKPRNAPSQGMHNFLSRDGELPLNFLDMAHQELLAYGVQHIRSKAIYAAKLENHGFLVRDNLGEEFLGKRLLLATGVQDVIPDIPGMQELWGRGVYHCPFCDGYELCDKPIGLYARNFNGFGMALALRQLSAGICLFTDGKGYLRPAQHEELNARGIRIISGEIGQLRHTADRLTCVQLKNGESIACEALFVHDGQKVNNELLIQLGARMTKKGAAITSRKQACSVPGLYVAGDAAIDIHFVVVAAAEGAKAAVAIHDELLVAENQLSE